MTEPFHRLFTDYVWYDIQLFNHSSNMRKWDLARLTHEAMFGVIEKIYEPSDDSFSYRVHYHATYNDHNGDGDDAERNYTWYDRSGSRIRGRIIAFLWDYHPVGKNGEGKGLPIICKITNRAAAAQRDEAQNVPDSTGTISAPDYDDALDQVNLGHTPESAAEAVKTEDTIRELAVRQMLLTMELPADNEQWKLAGRNVYQQLKGDVSRATSSMVRGYYDQLFPGARRPVTAPIVR
jgi:hypothetical protein